jgi:uncharacterized membrane protein
MNAFKTFLKYLFALIFIAAGINHFWHPQFYLRMMPPYLPWHEFLVALSGVFELALGVTLLIPKYTRASAWALIALLIAVFPANIQMALHPETFPEFSPTSLIWVRPPLQFAAIALVYLLTLPRRDARRA